MVVELLHTGYYGWDETRHQNDGLIGTTLELGGCIFSKLLFRIENSYTREQEKHTVISGRYNKKRSCCVTILIIETFFDTVRLPFTARRSITFS